VGADALDPAYLADLDRLFRDITIAAPPGWEEKKRVFQRDVQADDVALRGIYLELVLGVTLIRAGVPLAFPARPDIVVNGALGLEATAIKPEFSYCGERPLDAFSREVDFVKEKIVLTAESKQHQAADYPTLLVVGIAHAWAASVRHQSTWAYDLREIYTHIGAFAGVVVVNVNYGEPLVHSAVSVTDDSRLPAAEWAEVKRSFGWGPLTLPGS
jgi:hypothetical protein